jgi:hypothetical protein
MLTLPAESSDISYYIFFFSLPIFNLFRSVLYTNTWLFIFQSKNKGARYTRVNPVCMYVWNQSSALHLGEVVAGHGSNPGPHQCHTCRQPNMYILRWLNWFSSCWSFMPEAGFLVRDSDLLVTGWQGQVFVGGPSSIHLGWGKTLDHWEMFSRGLQL